MAKEKGLLANTFSLSQKATALRLMSHSIAKSLQVGNFRSFYKGRGVDYAGAREYLYGDDIRTIDWNVTARMTKPYIKLFEEDKELIVFLLVDRSASMETGSGAKSRIETATEAAALVLFASMQNSSPIGAVLFNGETEFSCKPKTGKDHAMVLFSKLDARPVRTKQGTSLAHALRGSSILLRNRSLVLIFSDFRCSGYEKELSLLAAKHDVIAITIQDPSDFSLPQIGMIDFFDPETQVKKALPTISKTFQKEWAAHNQRHFERWKSFCLKHGVETIVLSTDTDPSQELIRYFSTRSKK